MVTASYICKQLNKIMKVKYGDDKLLWMLDLKQTFNIFSNLHEEAFSNSLQSLSNFIDNQFIEL